MGAPLRIGVLLASATLPAWQHRLLCELTLEDDARLALVAWLHGAPVPRPRGLAFRAYQRLDRALFRSPRDPLAAVDASELLAACPLLDVHAGPGSAAFALRSEDVVALRAHQLDVLLQLGGGLLRGDVLDVARLGLWSFDHEEQARRGAAPFFSEMADGLSVAETRLVARTPAGTQVLVRSFASTSPSSLEHNLGAAHWKASDLPARAIRGYAAGREPPFDGAGAGDAPSAGARAPGAFEVARFVAATAVRVARNRARLRNQERVWFIALRRWSGAPLATDPLAGFVPLPCPPDRFHADPMLISRGDEHHLFFEDADRASGLGAIAYRSIAPDGRAGPVHRILEDATHFSYPFVFEWRGSWYLIPESAERRTIELYRATEFPLRWQLEKVLFHDVAAVDTTVFEDRGRLWLFTAMSPSGGSPNDELFLFHADAPTGDWVSHPMNPIVADVRHARPAGALFREGGALLRPGQDCAGDYGAAFWLHRVDVLDPQHYRETPLRRIDASWHPGGLCSHTYTRSGRFEAMDNRVWMPRS